MKPRITKPEPGNKYYINIADGGWNGAKGNPLRLNKNLTSLPNCVSVYGWFNEIGQQGMVYLKAPWYPYSVINAAKREGLKVTTAPTLGGIMVWTGGRSGEGHVAGVGQLTGDGKVLTVESEYYGRDWATFWRTKGDGNWRDGCYWMNAAYKYQGCIKNPFVKEEEDLTREQTEALIKEMVPQIVKQMEKDREQLPADEWAVPYIEWAKEKGLTDGTRPKSSLEREEAAAMEKAIYDAVMEEVKTI